MDSVSAHDIQAISTEILTRARQYGADLAGFAAVSDLKLAPSSEFSEYLAESDDSATASFHTEGLPQGSVTWPEGARTVLVIGVHHPSHKPEMDWWSGPKDPPGNRILARIVRKLCSWISEQYQIGVFHFPYNLERGGIYLKDAAVLSGIGCMGKNNMVVSPEYGPRIRLRALSLSVDVPSTGEMEFDPCSECEGWCLNVCPQQAFSKKIRYPDNSQHDLPGRNGSYSRKRCKIQMQNDEESAQEQRIEGEDSLVKLTKYCRLCELACPVGRFKSE